MRLQENNRVIVWQYYLLFSYFVYEHIMRTSWRVAGSFVCLLTQDNRVARKPMVSTAVPASATTTYVFLVMLGVPEL